MHGTILSSIYPRLPFASETLTELRTRARTGDSPNNGYFHVNTAELAVVSDLLPKYQVADNGTPLTIQFRLILDEMDETSPEWKRIKKQVKGCGTRSVLLDNSLDETHGVNFVTFEVRDVKDQFVCTNPRLVNLNHRSPASTDFRFTLWIVLQKFADPIELVSSTHSQNRTALLARELIGGYRHLICQVQQFLCHAPHGSVIKGKVSESDFHATVEDSARLMCHFRYIAGRYKKSLGKDFIDAINGFGTSAYDDWTRNRLGAVQDGLNEIEDLYRISNRIIGRKLFEYAIYRSLGTHFASLGLEVNGQPLDALPLH